MHQNILFFKNVILKISKLSFNDNQMENYLLNKANFFQQKIKNKYCWINKTKFIPNLAAEFIKFKIFFSIIAKKDFIQFGFVLVACIHKNKIYEFI